MAYDCRLMQAISALDEETSVNETRGALPMEAAKLWES
jgi:hypothetical protein